MLQALPCNIKDVITLYVMFLYFTPNNMIYLLIYLNGGLFMATTMSLGSQIQSVYPNLTKSEKKVATYIMKHIDDIAAQTLAQMSKKAGI